MDGQGKEGILDMTAGNPSFLLLRFSLPLVFGNLFQQLYTFVDTMIVGQKLGMRAAFLIGTATACVMSFIMFVFGKPILGLFLRDIQAEADAAISLGYQFLCILAVFSHFYIYYILCAPVFRAWAILFYQCFLVLYKFLCVSPARLA